MTGSSKEPRESSDLHRHVAADQARIDDVEQAVADYLAWAQIVGEVEARNLDPHQEGQARKRLEDADRTVGLRLAEAYQWLLSPHQPEPNGEIEWDISKADGQGGLAERAAAKLEHGGGLFAQYPPVLLRIQLDGPLAPVWESGSTTVAELWEVYARYLYLQRLRDIEVLCRCVSSAADSILASDGVVLAEGLASKAGAYVGLGTVGVVRGSTVVVRPDVAQVQLSSTAAVVVGGSAELTVVSPSPTGAEEAGPGRQRSFYGVANLDPGRVGRDAGRIAEEVAAHLHGLVGTDMKVTIEIRASNPEGFPDDVVRIVNENAAALRFQSHDFEGE
ncbi:MAG: hypothetical protein ACRDX8_11605 [Acidimicrobiales bacterium]